MGRRRPSKSCVRNFPDSSLSTRRVQYRPEQATQWQEKELDAVNLSARDTYGGGYTVPRLRHATVYLARVASKNAYGYSDYGEIFKFATKGAG